MKPAGARHLHILIPYCLHQLQIAIPENGAPCPCLLLTMCGEATT
jgi:hypothetical protein